METSPPRIYFKDRKTDLVVFGIFTVLMGGVCAVFVPLMFLGQTMAEKNRTPQGAQAIVFIFGLLAVALVWLGIGSMMARRWARALMLIFSWNWLIFGSFGMLLTGWMRLASPPGQPQSSPELQLLAATIALMVTSVIFVGLPIVWVRFYQNQNVKATCEARDPVERWTDRCPLPVLTASLWMAFSVPFMLATLVANRSVVPAFGALVSGSLGSALSLFFAAIWGYGAWAFYKLDRRGWRAITVFLALSSISSAITYSRHDASEVWALMGYSSEKIAKFQKVSLFKGGNMAWASLLAILPSLGYLIYLRRFFPRPREEIQGDV